MPRRGQTRQPCPLAHGRMLVEIRQRDAEVYVPAFDASLGGAGKHATSTQNGMARFEDLAPGEYTVYGAPKEANADLVVDPNYVKAAVKAGEVTVVQLLATRLGMLRVKVEEVGGGAIEQAQIAAAGPQKYELRSVKDEWTPLRVRTGTYEVTVKLPAAFGALEAKKKDQAVAAGKSTDVTFKVAKATFRVVDASAGGGGAGVERAGVKVKAPDVAEAVTKTDAKGDAVVRFWDSAAGGCDVLAIEGPGDDPWEVVDVKTT